MKIKTQDLTGAALDWAVAKCEEPVGGYKSWVQADMDRGIPPAGARYSTDWLWGGPIIERERISIRQWTNVPVVHAYMPQDDAPWSEDGSSPLIAAMRCFCASRLGDEIDIPDELIKENQP